MTTAGIVGIGYIAVLVAIGIGIFGRQGMTEKDLTTGFLMAVVAAVIGLVALVFSFATKAHLTEGLWYIASEIVAAIVVQVGFILVRERRLDNAGSLIFSAR